MYRASDTYKNIFKGNEENLKEIKDKLDCLQRSQIYVHGHITKVEKSLDEFKSLLQILTDSKPYDLQMSEVN